MSRQFDFERHHQAFPEIPQTASAKSGEQSQIQQKMSVESLAPGFIGAAPSLTSLPSGLPAAQIASVRGRLGGRESGSHE